MKSITFACDDCDAYCPDNNHCALISTKEQIKDWEHGLYPDCCLYMKKEVQE